MILDQLKRADAYRGLGERFLAGFGYLREFYVDRVPVGRHDIVGSDVFALVQSYRTKPIEEGRWEAHRRYADIQYVAAGEEKIGVAAIGQMRVEEPHDPDKDIAFFTGVGQFILVEAGSFALFLPHDVHMPSIAIAGPADVKKVVVKVRIA